MKGTSCCAAMKRKAFVPNLAKKARVKTTAHQSPVPVSESSATNGRQSNGWLYNENE